MQTRLLAALHQGPITEPAYIDAYTCSLVLASLFKQGRCAIKSMCSFQPMENRERHIYETAFYSHLFLLTQHLYFPRSSHKGTLRKHCFTYTVQRKRDLWRSLTHWPDCHTFSMACKQTHSENKGRGSFIFPVGRL